jgi:hypothetical protein
VERVSSNVVDRSSEKFGPSGSGEVVLLFFHHAVIDRSGKSGSSDLDLVVLIYLLPLVTDGIDCCLNRSSDRCTCDDAELKTNEAPVPRNNRPLKPADGNMDPGLIRHGSCM